MLTVVDVFERGLKRGINGCQSTARNSTLFVLIAYLPRFFFC